MCKNGKDNALNLLELLRNKLIQVPSFTPANIRVLALFKQPGCGEVADKRRWPKGCRRFFVFAPSRPLFCAVSGKNNQSCQALFGGFANLASQPTALKSTLGENGVDFSLS
jgi:hypothetical protein